MLLYNYYRVLIIFVWSYKFVELKKKNYNRILWEGRRMFVEKHGFCPGALIIVALIVNDKFKSEPTASLPLKLWCVSSVIRIVISKTRVHECKYHASS